MKKIKLLAIALVIGTASLFAFETNNFEGPEKEIRNEIVKLLKSPDFVVDEDINIMLKFTFNSEGEIVIICPGCKDKRLVNYIRKNLNQKKFKNPGERDRIYKLPLTIKTV